MQRLWESISAEDAGKTRTEIELYIVPSKPSKKNFFYT